MTAPQRFYAIIIAAGLCLTAPHARAQGLLPTPAQPPQASSQSALQPASPYGRQPGVPFRSRIPTPAPSASTPASPIASTTVTDKPQPGVPATPRPTLHSLLDEPATPAQIHLTDDTLSITATNASLAELIRQVATRTGMQVEGNSRDERVFGTWGPGSPPDILSALLYDTGYNVMMIGATADGAPRRLVLTTRTAGSTAPSTSASTRTSDEDDEETPAEPPPPPQANPAPPATSGAPPAPGQPKTPQQMLEELQRMHQGQQSTDLPHDNN